MRICFISRSLPEPLILNQYLHLGPDFEIEVLVAASPESSSREIFALPDKEPSHASIKLRHLAANRDGDLKRKEVLQYATSADVIQSLDGSLHMMNLLSEIREKYACRTVVNVLTNCVPCEPLEAEEKERARALYQQIHAFLVHSRGARRFLLMSDVPEAKVHLIPPGVESSVVEGKEPDPSVARALGITESHFVVVAWCPLRWESGVYEILGAAKEILRWGKQDRIRILVFGIGPERESLRKWIRTENLGSFVAVGSDPHPSRVGGILGLTDLFVVPSIPTREWSEPLPMRMLLAMAAGVPVVASHIGEIPDFLSNGGILIPPRQHYDLADAIVRFSENPGNLLPYSRAAKARAKDQFDVKQTAIRLRRFYEELLEA